MSGQMPHVVSAGVRATMGSKEGGMAGGVEKRE